MRQISTATTLPFHPFAATSPTLKTPLLGIREIKCTYTIINLSPPRLTIDAPCKRKFSARYVCCILRTTKIKLLVFFLLSLSFPRSPSNSSTFLSSPTRLYREHEYRRQQQARRQNTGETDDSNDKDAYEHVKEAEDGSIYSSADKSLCIAPNDNDDIVVRPCTNYDRREWTTVIVEGTKSDERTYKFITWQNNDDKCITVRDDVKEGAKLKMGPCRDREDYLWKLDDGGKWRPKADLGLCVDLGNAQQGIKPTLRDCDDTKFQKWNVGKGKKDSSNSDSDESDDKTEESDESDDSFDEDGSLKNRIISPRLDDDLCVSVENQDSIALEECNGENIQSWTLLAMDTDDLAHHEEDGRYYMVQSGEDSDKCIDVSDAREDRRLRLVDCNSKDRHQFWDLDNKGRLHPLDDDDLCSEISNVRDGVNLRLVQCSSRDRQQWVLSRSSRQDGDSNASEDSDDSDDNDKTKKSKAGTVTPLLDEDLCVAADGDEISLEKCRDGRNDQGWYIVSVESSNRDYYDYPMVVSEANNDMCLDVTDAKEGRKIILAKCDEDDKHQRWDIEDGRRWRPMDDRSLCADIQLVREGTVIRLMDCSGTDRQRWNYNDGDSKDSKESGSSDDSNDDKKKKSDESGDDKKKDKSSDDKDSKDSEDSEEDCSGDESEDDEHHVTMVFYGKGKTTKSTKSSKNSKGSKGGYYPSPLPRPTHYIQPPSCKPKPSPSSDDYWDHVKESSKGSIYSLADKSLCVAFNDDNDILMRGCTDSKDRQWSLMAIAGDSGDDMTYKFITWKKDRNKCITVRGQIKEGSELRMAKCDNNEDFLWKFNEGNKWRPKTDLGLCVDLDKVREGTRPTLEDCRDTSRQRWDVGKGDESRPSSPSRPGSPSSPSASRPGARPTPRPTQDPATCSADRTCGRPRRPI